ncbi:MAG: hypothetical protein Q9187_004189 [Circinaria calcarea]
MNENRSGISLVNFTGLHIASFLGLSNVVSALGSVEVDINETVDGGWTALHCATANGHYDVVQVLLDVNASWTLTDSKDGWTPLHLAVRGNDERIVQLLLEQGAFSDPKDIQGRTPLHLAAWAGNEHSARRLLTAGANVSAVNSNGGAALHWAARRGHQKIAEALLEFGADIDAIDHTGSTALHDAVRNDQKQVEQLLINHGANRDIKDFANRSVAELAWSSNGPSRLGKPSTFDWSAYETDEELSGQIRDGTQAACRILRKKGKENCLEDGEGVDDDLPEIIFRKTFDLQNDKDGKVKKYLLTEHRILQTLDHPYIVSYLGYEEPIEKEASVLYLQFCDGGDLEQVHGLPPGRDVWENEDGFYTADALPDTNRVPLSEEQMWSIIYQICLALAYLHHGLSITCKGKVFVAKFEVNWDPTIHRDIKPANVVLQRSDTKRITTKLCDLGIAKAEKNKETVLFSQFIGTPGFLPPEVQSGLYWTTKGDIYSLGGRQRPSPCSMPLLTSNIETLRNLYKVVSDPSSNEIAELINHCTERHLRRRPSCLTILEQAYNHLEAQGGEVVSAELRDQMNSVHSILGKTSHSYLYRAFALVATQLDDYHNFFKDSTKDRRDSLLKRLDTLLKDGADDVFNKVTDVDSLHLCVLLGKEQQLVHLLNQNTVDATNSKWPRSGWTPLHLAAQEGQPGMVRQLLERGASRHIKDIYDQIPEQYARDGKFSAVMDLLSSPSTSTSIRNG